MLDFYGNLWDVLPDLPTRVGSALLMHRPSQRYLIGPFTWLLSRQQNNLIRMYCLFSWAFVEPFIPFGSANFPLKNRFRSGSQSEQILGAAVFSGLFERLLFFVLGDSQVYYGT